jgi:SAM-dependent MidA family methyltransferase
LDNPDSVASEETLPAFLLRIQEECGGVIPFHRFMAEALHHPRFGYYGAQIATVGARGDFSTSVTLSDHLGKSIAAWAISRSREEGWRRIPLIEIGAGSGVLARTILRHLGLFLRLRTDYRIIETSGILKQQQHKLLRGSGVRWHDSVQEALEAFGGRALLFSNELVDAFPCRLFQKTPEGWRELGVNFSPEGGLMERLINGTLDDPWFTPFESLPGGQRVERHDSYCHWLGSWSDSWKEGSLLTIDYGDLAPDLYARRPAGSLRGYWKHRRLTGGEVYARFGKQDLTADVNFSDLKAWGHSLKWSTASYTTQQEFLQKWSPKNQSGISSPENGEVWEAFKVLEQSPNSSLTC